MTFLRKQIRGSGVPFVPQAAKTYFEPTDAIDATNVQDAIEAISAGKFDPTFGDVTASGLTIGSLNGMLKGVSGVVSVATKGTDYAGIDYANTFTLLQTVAVSLLTASDDFTRGNNPTVMVQNPVAASATETRHSAKLNLRANGWNSSTNKAYEWCIMGDSQTNDNPEFKIFLEKNDTNTWTKIFSIDASGNYLVALKHAGTYQVGASQQYGLQLSTGGAATSVITSNWTPGVYFNSTVWDGGASRSSSWNIYSAPYPGASYASVVRFTAGRATATPDTDIMALWWDGTNKRMGIGTNTPSYAIDAVGEINASTGYRVGGSAGATGSFTTADSKTVTVTAGLITAIV